MCQFMPSAWNSTPVDPQCTRCGGGGGSSSFAGNKWRGASGEKSGFVWPAAATARSSEATTATTRMCSVTELLQECPGGCNVIGVSLGRRGGNELLRRIACDVDAA